MAITVVQSPTSSGSAAASTITLTSTAVRGNLLVAFGSFIGAGVATFTDSASGTWQTDPRMSTYGGTTNSLQVATKVAAGGETSVSMSSSGTAEGIVVYELSGSSGRLDNVIVQNTSTGSLTALAVPTFTTTNKNAMVLGAIGLVSGSGTVSGWTGTPSLAKSPGTSASARCWGGSGLPAALVSSPTSTGHWPTTATGAMSMVATVVPAGGAAILF